IEAQLQKCASQALQMAGEGSGRAYGTKVHTIFQDLVNALGNPDLTTEQSYLNGKPVNYGTPGSTRFDVVHRDINNPTWTYDLKTGGANMSNIRAAWMLSHLPTGSGAGITLIRP